MFICIYICTHVYIPICTLRIYFVAHVCVHVYMPVCICVISEYMYMQVHIHVCASMLKLEVDVIACHHDYYLPHIIKEGSLVESEAHCLN